MPTSEEGNVGGQTAGTCTFYCSSASGLFPLLTSVYFSCDSAFCQMACCCWFKSPMQTGKGFVTPCSWHSYKTLVNCDTHACAGGAGDHGLSFCTFPPNTWRWPTSQIAEGVCYTTPSSLGACPPWTGPSPCTVVLRRWVHVFHRWSWGTLWRSPCSFPTSLCTRWAVQIKSGRTLSKVS